MFASWIPEITELAAQRNKYGGKYTKDVRRRYTGAYLLVFFSRVFPFFRFVVFVHFLLEIPSINFPLSFCSVSFCSVKFFDLVSSGFSLFLMINDCFILVFFTLLFLLVLNMSMFSLVLIDNNINKYMNRHSHSHSFFGLFDLLDCSR